MLKAFKWLMAGVFLAHTLTASFWVMCHEPGPGGHDRLELAWATCCQDEADEAPGKFPCDSKLNGCTKCHDEKLLPPSLLKPHHDQGANLALAVAFLPVPESCFQICEVRSQVLLFAPDHPGDPPLFLTLCNFRI